MERQKVQFDFSAEALNRLEKVKEQVEAPTKAEVIRNALKWYEWFMLEVEPTSVIVIEDKDGRTIFRLPVKALRS